MLPNISLEETRSSYQMDMHLTNSLAYAVAACSSTSKSPMYLQHGSRNGKNRLAHTGLVQTSRAKCKFRGFESKTLNPKLSVFRDGMEGGAVQPRHDMESSRCRDQGTFNRKMQIVWSQNSSHMSI
jgi:hypothetical protein